MPFIYSSERHNAVKYDNNPELGPGTYNNYNTFFQWNKKSYNAKIKDRIDEFKKLKIWFYTKKHTTIFFLRLVILIFLIMIIYHEILLI